jgi:hypothetical protein
MSKSIIDIVQRIFVIGKAKIALFVKPYFGRGKVLDENPLTNIELSSLDEKGILDILLNNELSGLSECVISDIVEVIKASNSSPPRHNYLSTSLQLGLAIQTFLIPLIAC